MATGRFAPSPSGELHLGNLRTALLAWLFARGADSPFLVRIEDLDPARSRPEHEQGQIDDLRAIGLDWDGEVVHQSERTDLYRDALRELEDAGSVYPCWCTRAEIRAAAQAPHGPLPEGSYPGTCRGLTSKQRIARERDAGRRPSLRLDARGASAAMATVSTPAARRSGPADADSRPSDAKRDGPPSVAFDDRLHGRFGSAVDDFVLWRWDDTPAYNLAVVVDDAAQEVGEVVRGDDLLDTTPRQILLQRALGLPTPAYAHVPLVLAPNGERLAKRHGAVTLADRAALGETAADAVAWMAASLGLAAAGECPSAADLVAGFDPAALPREPATFAG
jgi:glutamyl-tRNA synthetase